jgi:hypothetical protein
VAKRVIHDLEAVKIDVHQRAGTKLVRRPREQFVEKRVKVSAIGEACQAVEQG